ncbi:shikimate dehydrogenase [Nisaea sp.]|uniref:shikimate dehydrogenase n=1 Tax=Nisaea sp. TaxID=2024842 RepID=UPI0032F004C6
MERRDGAVLVGLIGNGIGSSRTPAMHEAEGAAQGINYRYDLIDTERESAADLGVELARVRAAGFTGVNITHPHKQRVLEHVDVLSEEVSRVGASNTLVFQDGLTHAYNTDFLGFHDAFVSEMAGQPLGRVLLTGAGGAGRAVGMALAQTGVSCLVVADRDAASAVRLAEDVRCGWPDMSVELLDPDDLTGHGFDGIVNATPMGMARYPGMSVPQDLLAGRPWVVDIVYFPLETALLRAARSMGCVTMSGRGMAIMQAVRAFELFTGATADVDRMGAVFDSFGS